MKRILFVDGTEHFNPHTINEKPTGGILNSLTIIPQYLASKDFDVYVMSKHSVIETYKGVHYVPEETENLPKWDYVVFNRNVLPQDFIIYSKSIRAKIIWWLHDVVQMTYLPDASFKLVDKIVALSDYCKQTYKEFYSLSDDKFTVIPNGVDKNIFKEGNYENRNPNLWLTASALIKGHKAIPSIYNNLKRHNPKVDFRIYSNQSLHGLQNSEIQDKFLADMIGGGAHVYAPVAPHVLADILKRAHCLIMPNEYPEICSNLLLQAKACGCPVIASSIGANKEFIKHKEDGLLTKWYPHDLHMWIVEMSQLAIDLELDKDLHRKLSMNGPKDVYSWEEIGEKWINELFS